tara:strand:+ start:154 stop:762 length:609 start_codon:yes stop_codon:yes gene_type:complete
VAIITPTSELEAVNVMLSAIGEAPVSSLDDPSLVDAALAQSILGETSVEIQTRGLHSNTEINYPLVPTVDGEILVPSNCARIDTTDLSRDIDVTQRGNKLYDRGERSYTSFTEKIFVDMVLLFSFEELPQHVKRYITVKAARRFQARLVGSDLLASFTALDEQEALIEFERGEAINEDSNILTDSFDTFKIISRGSSRRTIR